MPSSCPPRRHRLPVAVFVSFAACLGLAACGGTDGNPAQAVAAIETSDGAELDADAAALDTAFDVALDSTAQCPGAAGCSCKEAVDCNNGLCIETPSGQKCAATCSDSCPFAGFKCAVVPQGNDVVQLCIPRWGRLCEPCAGDKMCADALGSDSAMCVDYGGEQGAFCGAACLADDDCPTGYACGKATSLTGKIGQQCMRKPEVDGTILCPCDVRAVQQQLVTQCAAAATTGSCPGTRQCSATGLGACTAPKAAKEVCDGLDNDCNGQTDEGLCGDQNPCTDDKCDAKAGGCVNEPNAQPCSDGNACTGPDLCAGGTCKAALTDCDDKNPCTDDTCDPQAGGGTGSGCLHTATNKPCNDTNACTQNDLCDGKGGCLGASLDIAVACNDNNPCTADVCDPGQGCGHAAQAGPCEDGNPCTNGDTCAVGACKAGENICSCLTDDDCKAKEDSDLCNGTLYCDKAASPYVCKIDPKTVVLCDVVADTTCLKTACSTATGQCAQIAAADAKPCDADGSVCTQADACAAGKCLAGIKIACDDGNPCTDDTCDAKTGCKQVFNVGPCSDGSACTLGDTCSTGGCLSGKKTACIDGSTCTIDSCDIKTGLCVFDGASLTGELCSDSNVCTLGDSCDAGKCVPGAAKNCDDQNSCTTDSCDAVSGCKHVDNGDVCDFDGSPCTPYDVCKNGNCAPGLKKNCDDGNPCTLDGCSTQTGACSHDTSALSGQACDDGDKCSKNDVCQAGQCTAGQAVDCDDADQCTTDSCDKVKGCLQIVVASGTPCNDGSACTLGDVCVANKCAGIKLECDDKNACTVDSCSPIGCLHESVKDGGTVAGTCDVNLYCVAGKCVTPSCGDGFQNAGEACDDGNKTACDGCESCQIQGALQLDGKGWAWASAKAGPAGTLLGALGLEQDLTLSAWVKPASFVAEDQIIVSKSLAGGNSAWKFGLSQGSGVPFFAHKFGTAEPVAATLAVQAGVWTHVAVVVAKDQVRFFVGGKPAGVKTLVKERHDCAAAVTVGAEFSDANGNVTGQMFTGSLDAVQVVAAALHGGPFVPVRRPQVTGATRALWLFDDLKGPVLADASGIGNGLTLAGTAATSKDACYGAAIDAAVCGDGKVAPGLETCDDGNGSACDGCESCQARRHFDVAATGAMTLPANANWAADAFCPTCEVTIEAWVRFNPSTAKTQVIFSSSCGYVGVFASGGSFYLVRAPEGPMTGSQAGSKVEGVTPTTIVNGKWYHVAAVFGWASGSEMRLYINGKLEARRIAGGGSGPADIGQDVGIVGAGSGSAPGECTASGFPVSTAASLDGQIDEVRVSQGLRYVEDFTPSRRLLPDRQTRGLWHFDDAPATASDDSGQAVAGQVAGVTAFSNDVCFGEAASTAICGDGGKPPARWEMCDDGGNNGDYPKACSRGCASSLEADCTALSWSVIPTPKGTKNFMTYPSALSGFTAWTIEGWVLMPQYPTGSYGVLVGVDANDGCPPMPVGQNWAVAVTSNGTDASGLAASAVAQASKPTQVWKLNTWQHFALQYHGLGKGSLYVDGVKVRDFASVPTSWDASCPVRLGSVHAQGQDWLAAGQMASLRLSKKVRYGQPFMPAWTLNADPATLWLFQFDSTGATQNTIDDAFSIDPKSGTAVGAGPACNK